LDGTVSTNVVSLLWEKVSGSGIVAFDPNAFVEDPIATFSAADIYVLRLTGNDGVLSNSDDVAITIVDPNAEDPTPPTPNPMTWQTPPYSTGSASIAMVAATASDAGGVEYYFACTCGGGYDSGWQDSTIYEDTGLNPNTQYCYQVKARDKSLNSNETAYSTAESAATDVGCTAGTTHVQSIFCQTAPGSKGRKFGQVHVTILDNCGNPVPQALVTGTFTGSYSEQASATTDAGGLAVITTSTQTRKPSYTFCVDDVFHETLAYQANDNIETCKSN